MADAGEGIVARAGTEIDSIATMDPYVPGDVRDDGVYAHTAVSDLGIGILTGSSREVDRSGCRRHEDVPASRVDPHRGDVVSSRADLAEASRGSGRGVERNIARGRLDGNRGGGKIRREIGSTGTDLGKGIGTRAARERDCSRGLHVDGGSSDEVPGAGTAPFADATRTDLSVGIVPRAADDGNASRSSVESDRTIGDISIGKATAMSKLSECVRTSASP